MRLAILVTLLSLTSCSLLFDSDGEVSPQAGGSDASATGFCGDLACGENEFCDMSSPSPSCECKQGFTGVDCEINIDDCALVTCANDGVCLDRVSGFECYCAEDWAGELCTCPIATVSLVSLEPPGASSTLDLGDVVVSSPGQVFAASTLGVAGGFGDHLLDGMSAEETLEFLFASPSTLISVESNIRGTGGTAVIGAVEIEAFGEKGDSLGIAQASGSQAISLRSMFGDEPIGRFTMTAKTAGFLGLASVRFKLQCD